MKRRKGRVGERRAMHTKLRVFLRGMSVQTSEDRANEGGVQ